MVSEVIGKVKEIVSLLGDSGIKQMAIPLIEPEKHRKLFIGGIDYNVSEKELRDFYSEFGEVVDCVLMKDPKTAASKGFGFVTYRSSAMLDNAQNQRPHRLKGREMQPKRAVPRELSRTIGARLTIYKIFVGGLNQDVEKQDLRDYFSGYGKIINTDIIREKDTGKKRGFAFVQFDDYDPVDKIILQRRHVLKGKKVEVKKAMSRVDMANIKKKKEMEAAQRYATRHGISVGEALVTDIIREKDTGKKRGFAFVQFDDYDPVDKIILQRRHILKGKKVEVKKAMSRVDMANIKKKKEMEAAQRYATRHGISVGEALVTDIIREKDTGKKRGFAFVQFDDYDPVDKIILQRRHILKGKKVEVKKAMSRVDMANIKKKKEMEAAQRYATRHGISVGEALVTDIIREKDTGKKRGFAFVQFDDYDPVDKIILQRRHILKGKKVEVKKAMSRVDMANIKKKKEMEAAQRYATRHGISVGEALVTDIIREKDTGKKRGFAFVQFDDYDPVDKIILQRRHVLKGKKVEVKKAMSRVDMANIKKKKEMEAAQRYATRHGISVGEALVTDIIREKDTGKKRGFAFVQFDDYDPVDKIILQRRHVLKGKKVEVKKAMSRVDMANIKKKKEMEAAQRYATRHGISVGEALVTDIIREKDTGKKRGFAFVQFDDYDPVDKIILQRRHILKGKKVEVKKAMSRVDMANIKKKKEMEAAQRYATRHGISVGEALVTIRRYRGAGLRIFRRIRRL